MNEQKVLSALHQSWTIHSSKQWSAENPALGQCNVTALVLQDQFGGDIFKTQVDGSWHFYNRIHDVILN